MSAYKGPFEFERHEIAKSLFDTIKEYGGEGWVAVRITGETGWEVCKPRSPEAMRRALATEGAELVAIKDHLRAVAREMMACDLIQDTAEDGIDLAFEELP